MPSEVTAATETVPHEERKSSVALEVHEVHSDEGNLSNEQISLKRHASPQHGNSSGVDLKDVLERLAELENKYESLQTKLEIQQQHESGPVPEVQASILPEAYPSVQPDIGHLPYSYGLDEPYGASDHPGLDALPLPHEMPLPPPPPPPPNVDLDTPFIPKEKIIRVKSELWASTRNVRASTAEAVLIVSMCSPTVHGLATQQIIHDDVVEKSALDDKTDFLGRVPDRVAIGCSVLVTEVAKISHVALTEAVNVILFPFKSLVTYHEEFRARLVSEHVNFEKLEAELMQSKNKLSTILSKKTENATTSLADVSAESQDMDKIANLAGGSPESSETEALADESSTVPGPSKEDVPPEFGDDTENDYLWDEEKELAEMELGDARDDLNTSSALINGLEALLSFLDVDLERMMSLRASVRDASLKEISFDDLWHLFQPGDVVLSTDRRQAYRVLHVTGGRLFRATGVIDEKKLSAAKVRKSPFILDCLYMDFDGKEFGATGKTMTIAPYLDERPISSLVVYPLAFAGEEASTIQKSLVDRGKKFVKLARVQHKRYTGLSLKDNGLRYEEIDSDVMIDFTLGYKDVRKGGLDIEIPTFDEGVIVENTLSDSRENEAIDGCPLEGCNCRGIISLDDTPFELRRRNAFCDSADLTARRTPEKDKHDKERGTMDNDRLILLPPRVVGYVFLNRRWYPLDISNVHSLERRRPDERDGFADLVLPDGHKNIVRALVKTFAKPSQSSSSEAKVIEAPQFQLDVVRGKGKGLIILLHGVPGVGKTSTAECVAQNTGRPLFPITCGDIGAATAKEVETNLESYFELAHKWGCVLLLDEADVFLGERLKGDIVQNSLVSVFLRVLEYYKGILILTTNRVGEFDEAIKSRIHIALYYPELDKRSTMQIWDNNLSNVRNAQRIEFDNKDIKSFARRHWLDSEALSPPTHWNGRQIKNAFQTAIALAEWDHIDAVKAKTREKGSKPILESRHFETVKAASARFDHYLKSARGKTDGELAKEKGFRRDDINAKGDIVKRASSLGYENHSKASNKVIQSTELGSSPSSDSSDSADDTDTDVDSDLVERMAKEQREREAEAKKRKAKEDREKKEKKEQRRKKKEARKKEQEKQDSDRSRWSDHSGSDSEAMIARNEERRREEIEMREKDHQEAMERKEQRRKERKANDVKKDIKEGTKHEVTIADKDSSSDSGAD